MALHSLYCADVPLRNCSLTHAEASACVLSSRYAMLYYAILYTTDCPQPPHKPSYSYQPNQQPIQFQSFGKGRS